MAKKLTPKERRFVLAYLGEAAGNGAKAAVLAGYAANSARITASRLLTKPHIADEIANVRANHERASIADAAERREVLTGFLRDKEAHPLARLKAADILNKMDGLYIQKHLHSGTVTLETILSEASA